MEQLQRAVELYPTNAEAWFLLGQGYSRKNDFENMNKTENEKIFVIDNNSCNNDYSSIINFIESNLKRLPEYNHIEIREMLKEIIPEYKFNNIAKSNTEIN